MTTMPSVNLISQVHYLRKYAEKIDWQQATPELCLSVIEKIINSPPTEESWGALLELLAAWPEAADIRAWVEHLETKINHWPWTARQSILGQQQTRSDKECVYRLIGYLIIKDIDDSSGQKLKLWSRNKNWENLRGISLYKVETGAENIKEFLQSPYLKNLHTLELKALDTLAGKLDTIFSDTVLPHLRELHLQSLCLALPDIASLSRTEIGAQLTELDISSNFIQGKDLQFILSEKTFPSLEILNISHNKINAGELTRTVAELSHPKVSQIIFQNTPAAATLGVSSLVPGKL